MSKPKLAVIGASHFQMPLILKAQEMGCEVHAFAWECGDVGETAADAFHPVSIVEVDQIVEECRRIGVDGICTTRSNIVKATRELGLISLQRFFMIDSHSVSTSIESMKISEPDIVEIMPAIVTKKIREFSSLVDVPVIAGGLAETEEEVRDALAAGADCVSTGESELWDLKL